MSELSMPRCWNRESKPHRFCPGCGHGLVLKALGMAIDELGLGSGFCLRHRLFSWPGISLLSLACRPITGGLSR